MKKITVINDKKEGRDIGEAVRYFGIKDLRYVITFTLRDALSPYYHPDVEGPEEIIKSEGIISEVFFSTGYERREPEFMRFRPSPEEAEDRRIRNRMGNEILPIISEVYTDIPDPWKKTPSPRAERLEAANKYIEGDLTPPTGILLVKKIRGRVPIVLVTDREHYDLALGAVEHWCRKQKPEVPLIGPGKPGIKNWERAYETLEKLISERGNVS